MKTPGMNFIATSNDGKAKFAQTLSFVESEGLSAYANRATRTPLNRYRGQKAAAWQRGWEAGVELEIRIARGEVKP